MRTLKKIVPILLIVFAGFSFVGIRKNAIAIEKRDWPAFLQHESKWVDSVFASLNADERLGQLFMIPAYSNKDMKHVREVREVIEKYKIGGLIFMQGGPMREAKLTNYYQGLSKTPLMIAIDGEWGLAMRLDSTPHFPKQMTLGAIQNDSLIYYMGKEIALECKRMGIHVNFAPVADVNNNPKNPVISLRSFGEDKYQVARKAEMYMKGMQDNGVMANGKHFPGHGDTDKDSHKTLPSILHSKERLDTLELYPFNYLFDRGLSSIMVAHLFIPAYDSTKNQASTLSKKVVTDLLKTKMGFKGLIFTDALNMKGASDFNAVGVVDAKALLAGNDVLLFSENVEKAIEEIKKCIVKGEIKQTDIDEHCKRILKAKYWCGLNKPQVVRNKNLFEDLNNPKQDLLRMKLAEASMTLLQNKNEMLPLKSLDTLKIAEVSIGMEDKNTFCNFVAKYAKADHFGVKHDAKQKERDTILARLKNYDLVIIQVNRTNQNPEKNFDFSAESDTFLQQIITTKKTIVTFFSNPYLLGNIANLDKPEAIIMGYEYNGYSQKAAAEVIFGGIAVNGKLPVSSGNFKRGTGIVLKDHVRLQYTVPYALGIEKKNLAQVDSIALKGIKDKCYPGCRVLALKDGKVFYDKCFGTFTYDGTDTVRTESVYDLASITKISSSALGLMKLHGDGKLDVTKKVSDYLPEMVGSNKENLLMTEVMTHTSGLQAWLPLMNRTMSKKGVYKPGYYTTKSDPKHRLRVAAGMFTINAMPDSIFKQILESELKEKGKYLYSDVGYYLHKRIIEKNYGTSLDTFVETVFYKKLGLQSMMYKPYRALSYSMIAPTEDDKTFRKTQIWGDVHDPGAALMGGVGGHAGLFSNANDLAVIMTMLLNKGVYGGERYLDSNSVKLFAWRNYFPTCRRGLCFEKPETADGKDSPVSKECSAESFGHTGFTGTMAWADPKNGLVFIFLSNRVYPSATVNKLATSGIRGKIHKVFYDAIEKAKPVGSLLK
ncbi:MAG: serine hydrolase [Bacteroidia bacterium]|nr:serine hydrolase [Bacteroidia bacterium]